MWIELTALTGVTVWVNAEWIVDISGDSATGSNIRYTSGQHVEVSEHPGVIVDMIVDAASHPVNLGGEETGA